MAELSTESVRERKSDPTLRDLAAPFFRRKRLIAPTFVGVLLGTVVAAYLVSSFHEASMEILVSNERLDPILTPESTQAAGTPSPVGDVKVNSEIELLKSPDLLEKVVVANHLDDVERRSFTSRVVHGKQSDAWYIARAVKHLD